MCSAQPFESRTTEIRSLHEIAHIWRAIRAVDRRGRCRIRPTHATQTPHFQYISPKIRGRHVECERDEGSFGIRPNRSLTQL